MDWAKLMQEVLISFAPIIAAGLATLIGFAIKYVVERIRSSNNATIIMIAGIAVRYAETHFGPDTATGLQKEQVAIDFLCKQVKGLDRNTATQFVKAAYQAVFTNLIPLETGVATQSGTPSASSTTSLAGN